MEAKGKKKGFPNGTKGIHVFSCIFTRHVTNCQPQEPGWTATGTHTVRIFRLCFCLITKTITKTSWHSKRTVKHFRNLTLPPHLWSQSIILEKVPLHDCVHCVSIHTHHCKCSRESTWDLKVPLWLIKNCLKDRSTHVESCAKLEPETVEPATWVISSTSRGFNTQFKIKKKILTAKGFRKIH